MKKFIALVALVLVSASTMMYAQESNAAARRAERNSRAFTVRALWHIGVGRCATGS